VLSSGYPADRFMFVEGMVEDTLPATRPETISLLRLDTDLYRSTYHELVHLYPLLSVGGILILDDYGAFQGARAATNQFIEENKLPLFLSRIDNSVRLAVKLQL
jgi:O-methyltransferase